MIRADFHTHSTHSSDGRSTLTEQIKSAMEKGLNTICLTEHMDYDNHNYLLPSFLKDNPDIDLSAAKSMFICDTDKYVENIVSQKELFKEKIDVRIGIELGLQEHLGSHYKDYVAKYPFDFVIGSLHEAGGIDPYYKEFLDNKTPFEAYRFYFEKELECAKACTESFDIFGHIDYALRYHRPDGFTFSYDEYADILDKLLLFLIQSGKGIECNTGGFSYFGTEPNPRVSIIKRYRKLGGEIITIGSDAHKASDIARHFDKAEQILKECGFKYYTVFKDRTPDFIAI